MERGIGQLKRRFPVLHGEIRLSPERTTSVILACGVLHNICKSRNIPVEDADDDHVHNIAINEPVEEDNLPAMVEGNGDGIVVRNFIVETYFR